MKPMCAAIRVGCVCAGLLVGIGANADWQFSNFMNHANQKTCSAILSQGHSFDHDMNPHLPRGTLEVFRDEVTAKVRMANGEDPMTPVIAFHWLYPRGMATDVSSETAFYLWDPRSETLLPTIGTALTREWAISYELRDYMGGILVTEGGAVERVGDVVPNPANPGTLMFVPQADRRNAMYLDGGSVPNSSYWWDIPEMTLMYLMGEHEVTLKVNFPGHASYKPTASRHPIAAMWKIKGGDKAMAFVNTPNICP